MGRISSFLGFEGDQTRYEVSFFTHFLCDDVSNSLNYHFREYQRTTSLNGFPGPLRTTIAMSYCRTERKTPAGSFTTYLPTSFWDSTWFPIMFVTAYARTRHLIN